MYVYCNLLNSVITILTSTKTPQSTFARHTAKINNIDYFKYWYTPARVIVLDLRVLREYYVRKANYAHLRVTCAYLRVTYLVNIHKQRYKCVDARKVQSLRV